MRVIEEATLGGTIREGLSEKLRLGGCRQAKPSKEPGGKAS